MKVRHYIYLLLLAICFVACSKDEESSSLPDGQFIFQNDTILVSISFNKGVPYVLNAFIRGGSVCQLWNLVNSGEYPDINIGYSSYPSEILRMKAKFINNSSFDVTVTECELEKGNWAGYYPYKKVILPKQMYFKKDETVLDKNGDGILDSTQNI